MMLRTPLLILLTLTVVACASPRPVDHARFNEQPARSVLILPPANQTTAAQASELYYTSLAVPLSQAGFYVFPALVTQRIMQNEGIIDGAQLEHVPMSQFYERFGADMVLKTTVTQWDTSYVVISGSVTVGVQFELISTRTGEVLWQHRDRRVANTGSGNTNLLGMVLETALNTVQQDYIPLAREINQAAFARVPYGPYHPRYQTPEQYQERLRVWQEERD
ncbi:MAG: DUF799 family lipoprotein [Idiomarina sp.]|nr:DUF799 family lipoprotein [Idiomarina sp.]